MWCWICVGKADLYDGGFHCMASAACQGKLLRTWSVKPSQHLSFWEFCMTNLIQFTRKNPAFSPAPMPVLMWYHLSDNSWESLKIRQQTHVLLRTEHDSCRIADKRTLGDSWSSIPNVANAFAATLLEAQKMFFDVAISRGSKRATLAAWDAEAPEIRKANSRPSSTTLVGTWLCTFSSFHVL